MVDFEKLSIEQIESKLQNDLEFALHFVVDNQPNLIVSELMASGSENVVDSDTAFNNLLWLSENDVAKLREILSAVPYDNSAPNYTGHLRERVTQPDLFPSLFSKTDWLAIIGIVSAAIPVVSSLIGGGSGGGLSQAEQEAIRLEQERVKEEQERKARTNLFLIGGVIAIILVVVLVKSRTPKTSK
jgi:hypothetical protein